jgi:amino acid adenylation domain-containing protein
MQTLHGRRQILFDHVLIFENYPFASQDSATGPQASHLRAIERTHYDFSIVVHPGSSLQVQFTYNANALSAAEFVRIETQMRTLASTVIADANQPLSAIDLNGNRAAVSSHELPNGTVLDLFEAQAAHSPDAIAVEAFSRAISYRDLDERAETFARSLRAAGVGPGTPVALFLPNDIDYVASLLAVWKAAAVFVPLDIEAPAQRLSMLVAQIKPIVFVTCSNLLDRLADRLGGLPANLATWEADGSRSDVFESKTSNRSHERPAPASAAYVMFTSGSTGKPKAILSSHEALHHFIAWECNELQAGAGIRVANLAPVTFDVSLRDIFLPLAVGGTLCIPGIDIRRDGQKLADWLAEHAVAVVHAVPSLFRLTLTALQAQSRRLPAMQHVLFAGEMLRGADVDLAQRVLGAGVTLRNLYGPSETTLAKCCYRIGGAMDPGKAVPVGAPLPGTRVLIVKNGRLAAPGAIGEIYIGLPFAPLGYAGNPALTAESFIACPPEWGGDGILYRTGDLGRELADGTIEVCGRLDGQVKINGVRVELGEIEQAVLANPEVSAAVAITHARHDGDPALVCYYTAKRALEPAELRERLELGLPRASVPHFIVPLDAFPLGLNGKVDRRALPKPEELVTGRIPYVAPAGPAEERIAAIWGEVLGVRRIGVCTSFFEAGGDSLRAIRLLTRINGEFGSEISISGFFAKPTVRELALSVSPSVAVDAAIPALSDATDYVTSSAQRRLWVLAQLGGNPAAYTLPAAYRIDGPLDTAALIRALEALPSRHEALRTVFVPTTDWPRQRVLTNSDFRVTKNDLRGEADPDAAARALAIQNAERGFDLETGPLFAASLLTLGETRHLLLVNVHHIVSDAVSLTVMVEEILRMARGETLPPLRVQYKDYAASEATWLETPQAQAMKAWWYDELKDLPEPLNLPFDRYPEVPPSYDGARVSIRLDATPLNGLRELARQAGGTLFSGLLALTAALLQRHTGVDDMVLGTPVSRRDTVEQESQVGFYVNLLPLRIALREGETAASLIASVSSVLTAAIDHRAYPFDQLVHDLGLMRDNGLPPLFDVAVVFQDSSQQNFALDGVSVSLLDIDARIAKFPLTFEFVENADGVTLNLEYATALFDHGRIVRMAEHFCHLITAASIAPAQPVASLNIFGADERALLQTSGPALDLPPEATVSAAFAAWATRQPAAPAVICEDKQLTYAELATRVAALARKLAREGVRRGETVAVLLERSEHLAVAFLGILEAGAVYLPLDPAYPAERIAMMLKDSAARLVLTEPRHTGQLAGTDCVAIDIHAVDTTAKKPANRADKQNRPTPDDLAYLIFTSGSTGRPKGVLIEHRGAINLAMAQRHALGIEPRHRVLQFAPTSFDSSVWEMLMALLNGACLVVATPARAKDPAALAGYLAEARVTVATLPPVYLTELDDAALAPLEILITAGEAPDAARMVRLAHSLRCVNGYGPTEATVCASMHVVDPTADPGRPIPIGRAIANMEMPVLDRWGNLAPVGVLGEIHIGGTGLARGYLDRPAQTEAAFIPHPFIAGKKLYRTGDIAFVDADGNVVFAGRSDRQIKLRGFRVELDEIERSIARSPSVAAAAVVVQQRREEAELVAFIVSDGPHDLKASKIELARSLPDFMMPSRWILRDALPSTPSGKIDYVTLSRYELESSEPTGLIDPLEVLVGSIWREILGHGDFTREDRFFAVGGDSIRAIQVTGRLKAAGYAVEMRAFLATPTIAGLAAQLSTAPLTETLASLPPVAVDLSTIEGLFSA